MAKELKRTYCIYDGEPRVLIYEPNGAIRAYRHTGKAWEELKNAAETFARAYTIPSIEFTERFPNIGEPS